MADRFENVLGKDQYNKGVHLNDGKFGMTGWLKLVAQLVTEV